MGACCESNPDGYVTPSRVEKPGAAPMDQKPDIDELLKQPIKIEYFNGVYGRVDPIRQMLEHKKVKYRFIGYSEENWANLKESGDVGEMNILPIVNYGGESRQQSLAILRSLGTVHGYYNPSDWKTAGFVDMIVECYANLLDDLLKAMRLTEEREQTEAIEKIRDGKASCLLSICEKHLEKNATQMFIASDSLTIADFSLVSFIFNMIKNEQSPMYSTLEPIMMKYPNF